MNRYVYVCKIHGTIYTKSNQPNERFYQLSLALPNTGAPALGGFVTFGSLPESLRVKSGFSFSADILGHFAVKLQIFVSLWFLAM